MAGKRALLEMQGKSHAAVSAPDHVTAKPTLKKIGKAAAIQEDQALPSILEVFLE
jgi:hypothetical protein